MRERAAISIRALILLGLTLASLSAALLVGLRGYHLSSRLASNDENASPKTSALLLGAAPGYVAPHNSTEKPVPNQLMQVSNATASADGDALSATIVDRPRFAGAATSLAAPRKAVRDDAQLDKAASSLRDYRSALRQNPVGSNAEITGALLGKNSRGKRYLPADVKISDKGELTDQWNQPVFFHQISGTSMEIRSAGPDHIMWTNDDRVSR